MNKKYICYAAGLGAMLALASCESSEPKSSSGSLTPDSGRFVIAATTTGSGNSTPVLLTSESVDSGEVSAIGNGLVTNSASQWIFHKNHLYGLTYNQGNAGLSRSFYLGADGQMHPRDMEYKVSRFTSYGTYDNDIMLTSTGDGPTAQADANGYLPKTLLATYLDVEAETSRSNDTSTGLYSLENYLGNGEYVTLSGLLQQGSRLYCGVVPMGLSRYGAAAEQGKWVRPGYEHLVATADGGSNSSAYKKGELPGSQYPDECVVAIYDDNTLLRPKFARTSRISFPSGRFKSQYYQSIWADDKGDIYVFSPSYAKTMSSPLQRTSLPAGVCRIPKGATDFDDYYCNLEELSGGKSFMRCWPAGGSRFLLTMYSRPLDSTVTTSLTATQVAIFDAATKRLSYVSGLPSDVTSLGGNAMLHNGKVYLAFNVASGNPVLYAIDPLTATATKGAEIAATSVSGIGHLNVKQ